MFLIRFTTAFHFATQVFTKAFSYGNVCPSQVNMKTTSPQTTASKPFVYLFKGILNSIPILEHIHTQHFNEIIFTNIDKALPRQRAGILSSII